MSALERLQAERKSLLKDKPLVIMASLRFWLTYNSRTKGFFAKPKKNADGTKNYFEWECGVPGKQGVRFHVTLGDAC
jgi:ubiquitin-protein ligase